MGTIFQQQADGSIEPVAAPSRITTSPTEAARDTVAINDQLALAMRTTMAVRGIGLLDLTDAMGEDEADLEAVYAGEAEMTVAQLLQMHRVFGTHPGAWLDAIIDTGEAGCIRFDDAGKLALRIAALPSMAQEYLMAAAIRHITKGQTNAS